MNIHSNERVVKARLARPSGPRRWMTSSAADKLERMARRRTLSAAVVLGVLASCGGGGSTGNHDNGRQDAGAGEGGDASNPRTDGPAPGAEGSVPMPDGPA